MTYSVLMCCTWAEFSPLLQGIHNHHLALAESGDADLGYLTTQIQTRQNCRFSNSCNYPPGCTRRMRLGWVYNFQPDNCPPGPLTVCNGYRNTDLRCVCEKS